ncbi:hypothetical protein EVAR_17926_1 [Eumeta japonica]|uniref:FLYWCH-type domain-containing protein n=1 Tax=Eumeta variegata TaxID=151549 RepID=A0A4C1UZJ6_EUMVA|nr:hypothetical protein EVAR_17926_1 [Eumeta japonica]
MTTSGFCHFCYPVPGPRLTVSRFGKPAIQFGRYRFNIHSSSKAPRAVWVCSRVASGCLIFTTSRFGKPVIEYGRYRYNRIFRSLGPKGIWLCSRKSLGCKGKLVTINDTILKVYDSHNH